MSPKIVPCSNCGAVMTPQADGRTFACQYCAARMLVAVDGQQIAAGMHLDLSNIDNFLAQLANTLSAGYAEHTRLQVHGTYVLSIEVSLDPDVYLVQRHGQSVVATYRKLVRGISLRTETLTLERWVEKLTESIARHANTNARAAWVLSRLGGSANAQHKH